MSARSCDTMRARRSLSRLRHSFHSHGPAMSPMPTRMTSTPPRASMVASNWPCPTRNTTTPATTTPAPATTRMPAIQPPLPVSAASHGSRGEMADSRLRSCSSAARHTSVRPAAASSSGKKTAGLTPSGVCWTSSHTPAPRTTNAASWPRSPVRWTSVRRRRLPVRVAAARPAGAFASSASRCTVWSSGVKIHSAR